MRITGRGSAAIRATHAKTLEFSPDPEITERATCVVATAVQVEPARPLAGRVRISIRAGDRAAVLHARANPEWDPAGPAVVRRSSLRLPGTLATDADAVAADLPRDLVAALRDPGAQVVIDIAPAPDDEPVVVLFAAARVTTEALRAELAAADLVVAEDEGARALVGRAGSAPAVITGRVLVVATDELPGATLPPGLLITTGADAGVAGAAGTAGTGDRGTGDRVRVETVGLPPWLAVAAAAGAGAPAPLAVVPGAAELADVPAGYRVVLATGADELPALLTTAHRVRGTTAVTLAQRHTPPWTQAIGDPLHLPTRGTVHCCLHPSPGPADPRVHAAVAALLADGVPTRAAARALAELTGWSRRRAYDAVLEIGRSAR